MGTHCLKSVRLTALLVPSWTTSWALEPLYWTTLTLDSSSENWKKKALLGKLVFGFVCYVYVLVLSSVNISASRPSWLITSELEEESHWRDIKASSQTRDNISHSHFLFWEESFPSSLQNVLLYYFEWTPQATWKMWASEVRRRGILHNTL